MSGAGAMAGEDVRRGGYVPAVLCAAALGGWVAHLQSRAFGTEILLAMLVGAVVLLPVGIRIWQGRFDVFEPLTLIAGIYFLYFSFAPIFRFTTGDLALWGRTFETVYVRAFAGVLLAVVAMWVGYALPVGRAWGERLAPPLRLDETGLAVLRRWGWALTLGAFCGIALWTRMSGASPTRFLLPGLLTPTPDGGTTPEGTDVPYFFAVIEWFVTGFLLLSVSGGFRSRKLQALHWTAVLVMFVSTTFRFRVFIFVVASLTLYYLRRNRRPGPLVLLSSGSLLFLAAGWIAMMRFYFYSYGAVGSSTPPLSKIVESGLRDTWIFETFGAVAAMVPRFSGYVHADPLVYVFVLPVPRGLWPEKPMPDWLEIIGSAIGTPQVVGTGPAVPHFGEFYIAFGWLGIAVGMLLFGIFARMLWAFFRTDPSDPARQVIFAIANIWLFEVIIRGYLPQIVKEFCFFVLPGLLAMMAARRRQLRAPRVAADA